MNILFFGTPDFAAVSLQTLIDGGHRLVGVVTQPDREQGRNRRVIPSSVKSLAQAAGLSVWQPESPNVDSFVSTMAALTPQVIVVAAYGAILSRRILAIPSQGSFNLHASLLPKYRGASPVAAAILAGEEQTGVTVMRMSPRMDAGPILAQRATPIQATENTGELLDRLARLGADLLQETLVQVARGTVAEHAQDDSQATYCKLLNKDDGKLSWEQSAVDLHRLVRAMTPWPGAYTFWQKSVKPTQAVRLLIKKAVVAEGGPPGFLLGQIVHADAQGIVVATGEGSLRILQLQRAGKAILSAEEFLRGAMLSTEDRFVSSDDGPTA